MSSDGCADEGVSALGEPCCDSEWAERHLLILGGGSAAISAALRASELGGRATIMNDGLPMGGTCVNVGCVPSKTLIRAAETLHRAVNPPPFEGLATSGRMADFRSVMEQKRKLVEDLRSAKYAEVIVDDERIRFLTGRGRIVGARAIEVNGETVNGDAILIATGSRTMLPRLEGIKEVDYLTNESAFELNELPESLIVVGGGYIALECAQMFSRFGSRVTVVQRSQHLLSRQPVEVGEGLAGYLGNEGLEIVTGAELMRVDSTDAGVALEIRVNGEGRTLTATRILVATGRKGNAGGIGLEEIGIHPNGNGFVTVNDQLESSAEGVYAAGDVIGEELYVYTAAYEGALAAENALNGTAGKRDYTALPWVIFTDPQVAGVGWDEAQAEARGIEVDVASLSMEHVPRAIAARDTRGFVQLIRNRRDDHLVGARILASEGSELLMEISLAIKYGIPVSEIKTAFHPYLPLGEAVKLAALTFEKDVGKLSCCAV